MVPAVSLTRGAAGFARLGDPVTTLGARTTRPATATVPARKLATSKRERLRRRAARRRRRALGRDDVSRMRRPVGRLLDKDLLGSGSSSVERSLQRRTSMRVATLVLAAGTSQRFGRPKQLEALGESTVLQHAVRAFADVDGIAEVWVVTSEEH